TIGAGRRLDRTASGLLGAAIRRSRRLPGQGTKHMQAVTAEPSRIGIELQRRFRASPERVFRAWTHPVALREWWCPPNWIAGEIDIDLRIGGAYRIGMSRAGATGGGVSVSGHFLEVRPPER